MEPWMDADRYYIANMRDEQTEEKLYALDEAKGSLNSAIDSLEEFKAFRELIRSIQDVVEEIENYEKEIEDGSY